MYFKLMLIPICFAIVTIYFDKVILHILQIVGILEKESRINLFTNDELKLYNGIDKPDLYLSILGKVYNVSKGWAHYGPDKSYYFFVGRDGSRSFITGNFNESEANDRVEDLTKEELRSLNHWVQFYNKEYQRVGKLIGRYYNEDGKLTQYGKEVKKLIKSALRAKSEEEMEKLKYPPCNVEWDTVRGTRVWCTKQSGGIDRDWAGVPRQLYQPGLQDYRCACIKLGNEQMANLKQYEGCDSESESCYIKT